VAIESSSDGRVALISGASRGIGLAITNTLYNSGWKIVANSRNIIELKSAHEDKDFNRIHFVAGDCSVQAIAVTMVADALRLYGNVDLLVLNAGYGFFGGIESGSDQEIQEIVQSNVLGTIRLIRSVTPYMKAQNSGDIVIIGSNAGLRGGRNEAVYAATKHAQLGLAGSLDRELREFGIRVSCILPGNVDTSFGQSSSVAQRQRSERPLEPEDVARSLVFIVSQPKSMRITQVILLPMSQGS
jgi:NADP-dependent 3-hydroxy acid dehydrogenase YdfG